MAITPLLGRMILGAYGWKTVGEPPPDKKYVLVAAPHTSNWDFPFTLLAAFALGMHIRWLGKASLFRAPFGGLMRWLGGIAVDRSRSTQLVSSSAEALRRASGPLQLVVAPEGTRSRAREWKTGFHHMARGAGLPIQLSYLDWGQRRCGLGPLIDPGDDIDADIATIRAFYTPFKGRNADQFDAG